jgi:lysophospholipase L1-like esterase
MFYPIMTASILILLSIIFVILYVRVMRPPSNRPMKYIRMRSKRGVTGKVVVLVGDSITHGKMGFNYVDLLTKKLDGTQYQLVNAGRNGELAWNVLQRIDEIIECNPDIVAVMIGTNDAKGGLTEKEQNRYVRRMKLPRKPNREWFRESVLSLVEHLKRYTKARIALVSIPILGEESNHPAFIQSKKYSKTIQEVANEVHVAYLPFNEKLIEHLARNPSKPTRPYENVNVAIIKSMFKRYLFGRSWDKISQDNGFELLTDHVHLNSRGANIAASLIEEFILS